MANTNVQHDSILVSLSMTAGAGSYAGFAAVDGYQSFSAIGNNSPCQYSAYQCDANGNRVAGGAWETGFGVFTTSGTTLSRVTLSESSTGSFITWANPTTIRISNGPIAANYVGNDSGGVFGDKSDGALVYDGSTTILGMAPVANVYTLTRDIWASAITVNSGVTIKPVGFRIFVNGVLTITSGTIQNDGGAGTNGTNGVAGVAGAAGSGGQTWGNGTVARAGGNGLGITTAVAANGNPGAGAGLTSSLGGSGGNGDSATTTTGTGTVGSGVTVTAPTATVGVPRYTPDAVVGVKLGSSSSTPWTFGCGGGGGAVSQTSTGNCDSGGGGGGAAGVFIFARSIVNNGTISANGGVGGNGFCSGKANQAAGGGGGGGGGCVILVYQQFNGTAPTASGGAAGTGATFGTGSLGAVATAGGTGTVITIVV